MQTPIPLAHRIRNPLSSSLPDFLLIVRRQSINARCKAIKTYLAILAYFCSGTFGSVTFERVPLIFFFPLHIYPSDSNDRDIGSIGRTVKTYSKSSHIPRDYLMVVLNLLLVRICQAEEIITKCFSQDHNNAVIT